MNKKGNKLETINTKLNILLKSLLIFLLLSILISGLLYGGFISWNYLQDKKEKSLILEKAQKEAEQEAQLIDNLSHVRKLGEEATLEDLKLKLVDRKILDTLPASDCGDVGFCIYDEKERHVVALKFTVTNISDKEHTFNRRSFGALATIDNIEQVVDTYPYASDTYLKELGETYNSDNANLLLKPGQSKATWIVLEVNTDITNPIFLYPPSEPNSKWQIN